MNECSFNLDHYREILEAALANGYKFVGYNEAASFNADEKVCILRHDVDYLPEHSIQLGRVERELGIRSTIFFQVCAWTYNLREKVNTQTIHMLREMGHQIGLHFDVEWYSGVEWDELSDACNTDRKVFEAILGFAPSEIISFHNPGPFSERMLNQTIAGIRHTYEKEFFSDFKYLSDSQGWYEGCVCKVFEEGRYNRIQLLTHPYIWPVESNGFFMDMADMAEQRKQELLAYLIKHHPVCNNNEKLLIKLSE
jgi:hypothetical protein